MWSAKTEMNRLVLVCCLMAAATCLTLAMANRQMQERLKCMTSAEKCLRSGVEDDLCGVGRSLLNPSAGLQAFTMK